MSFVLTINNNLILTSRTQIIILDTWFAVGIFPVWSKRWGVICHLRDFPEIAPLCQLRDIHTKRIICNLRDFPEMAPFCLLWDFELSTCRPVPRGNLGKLGKLGYFGHTRNHIMHLEYLKNQIPEMVHYPLAPKIPEMAHYPPPAPIT